MHLTCLAIACVRGLGSDGGHVENAAAAIFLLSWSAFATKHYGSQVEPG